MLDLLAQLFDKGWIFILNNFTYIVEFVNHVLILNFCNFVSVLDVKLYAVLVLYFELSDQ